MQSESSRPFAGILPLLLPMGLLLSLVAGALVLSGVLGLVFLFSPVTWEHASAFVFPFIQDNAVGGWGCQLLPTPLRPSR